MAEEASGAASIRPPPVAKIGAVAVEAVGTERRRSFFTPVTWSIKRLFGGLM